MLFKKSFHIFDFFVLFAFILGSILLIVSCSVRERDNIFDPKSNLDTLNFKLLLKRADSVIQFNWNPPTNIDYKGFSIYRKVAGQATFTKIANLPSNSRSFTDSSIFMDDLHSYYLTIVGFSRESPPTPVLATIPGPGKIWILDQWNEYFYKYSYDLRYKFLTHYAIWIPHDLALNKKEHQLLVTYPFFHYVEILDSENGQFLDEIEDIRYPYACIYHPIQNSYWITDSTGILYQYSANNFKNRKIIDQHLKRPVMLAIGGAGKVYLLDKGLNQILMYNQNGIKIKSFTGYQQLTFVSARPPGTNVFFIEQSDDTESRIYKYSQISDRTTLFYTGPNISLVRESPFDQTVWIVQHSGGKAEILQLSANGLRLKSWNGYQKIEDLAVNPVNGNIIIADRGLHQIIHKQANGKLIGKIENAPYPFRILIE